LPLDGLPDVRVDIAVSFYEDVHYGAVVVAVLGVDLRGEPASVEGEPLLELLVEEFEDVVVFKAV